MNLTGRILYERTFPSGVKVRTTGTKTLDGSTKIAQNFVLSELANTKAAEDVKWIWNNDVEKHTKMLQDLRNRIGVITVTSWYRTPSFNKSVGGASNSLHLRALATDCWWKNLNNGQYKRIETEWRRICEQYGVIGGINRYTNGVHLSSREDLFGYHEFVVRDYRGKSGDW